MYDNEEEIREWEREGGAFLIKNGIIDTDDIEEIRKFKRESEKGKEIEKIDNEGREPFDIIKLNDKRSGNKMSYYEYTDSADNSSDNEKLVEEIQEFYNDDEEIEGLEKAVKTISEKLKTALLESFKTLNEYKTEMKDIPDLLAAVKLLGRLAAAGGAGKYPYPEKYPYPGKLKKSDQPILWSDMLSQMFPDEPDEDEFEKAEAPTKEKPWPTFAKEFKKNAREIKKAQDRLEEQFFDPYDRRI